jgi:uncharacterized protein YecA (UPF0149 family)
MDNKLGEVHLPEEMKSLSDSILKDIKIPRVKQRYILVKIGRNDLCPCNSGKKYKRCCLKP